MSATPAGRVAVQPAEAGAEEGPPGTDTHRLASAEWPGHNWCKMRRRLRVAFHISDKTFFRPKQPACLKSTHRTRACYSTRNQRVNMQMPPSSQRSTRFGNVAAATTTPCSSWDLCADDRRGAVGLRQQSGPPMRIRENVNRSCTAQAPSLRLVRPTKREEQSCEFISPLPQRFSEPHSPR